MTNSQENHSLMPRVTRNPILMRYGFLLAVLPALVVSSACAGEAVVTFSEDIAPIVHEKCTMCHRPGEVAPFVLTDYNSVKRRAKTIRRVVADGYMPPWHPEEGWGEFRGNLSLSDEEIDLIDRWVEAGVPEGDPARMPALPDYPEGWSLGEPDLIAEMEEAFEVRAEGNDIYRYFSLPLDVKADQWVRAVEVRPGARAVVHHVLFFLDNTGVARELEAKDPVPGFSGKGFKATGSLGGWAVGGTPLELSRDYAMPLPKGSDLVLQTHFHPSGKVESEKTRVGIYLADGAPAKRLIEFQVPPGFGGRTGLNVAPGDSKFELRDHMIVPEDLNLVTVWGHAHQICSSIQAEATLPDGSQLKLFRIGDWQFDWQGQYVYAEPVHLPRGTRIDAVITYDNSSENISNPNSLPRRIFWGEQSTDEMGSVIFQCVSADPEKHGALASGLGQQARESRERFAEAMQRGVRRLLVLKLDQNGDDRLALNETPKEHLTAFQRLDENGDGFVTVEEIDENGAFLDKE